MMIPAITRVVTTNGMERMPWASSASISSEMRMAPISAVIRHPAWAANPIAAIIGAISRVFT
ncbi:Uncharacterised protein [Mycobacteroides abscessus]|nr:Uncharacterised protein [Mycobacteroides abscessus]SIK60365.1 Uncharacterised protein [Mycobacteroides abscessus subsp. abscessus]SKU72076.1 Uncharacterised protein [Mycobacteroides abscessus subsp. abscessus]